MLASGEAGRGTARRDGRCVADATLSAGLPLPAQSVPPGGRAETPVGQTKAGVRPGWRFAMHSAGRSLDARAATIATMPAEPMSAQLSPIVPFLHYADLDAAAEWLPGVFGLDLRSLEREPSGTPRMAVLQHGNGIIFARQDAGAEALRGGRVYVYVDDVDAHHARVQANGVDAGEPRDEPWGDRVYNTHDLQGHPWTFATPIERS